MKKLFLVGLALLVCWRMFSAKSVYAQADCGGGFHCYKSIRGVCSDTESEYMTCSGNTYEDCMNSVWNCECGTVGGSGCTFDGGPAPTSAGGCTSNADCTANPEKKTCCDGVCRQSCGGGSGGCECSQPTDDTRLDLPEDGAVIKQASGDLMLSRANYSECDIIPEYCFGNECEYINSPELRYNGACWGTNPTNPCDGGTLIQPIPATDNGTLIHITTPGTYYWSAWQINACGMGWGSEVRSFTFEFDCTCTPPEAPTLSYPPNPTTFYNYNGYLRLSGSTVNSWGNECSGSYGQTYSICWGTNPSDPCNGGVQNVGLAIPCQPTATYYLELVKKPPADWMGYLTDV
jgi:hypothetical protein